MKASWLMNSDGITAKSAEYPKGSFSVRHRQGLMEVTFYKQLLSHCNLKERQIVFKCE